ncbi:MAG: hypothetical protein GY854_15950 [Deltaproteobacteria bacterium]|nr:hypothetical protein [Deltaproteobacteria bacterium]
MNREKNHNCRFFIVLLTCIFIVSACDFEEEEGYIQDNNQLEGTIEDLDTAETITAIYTVTTENGHIVEFYEPASGEILIGEEGFAGNEPVINLHDIEDMALPEIFTELMPGHEVPQVLISAELRRQDYLDLMEELGMDSNSQDYTKISMPAEDQMSPADLKIPTPVSIEGENELTPLWGSRCGANWFWNKFCQGHCHIPMSGLSACKAKYTAGSYNWKQCHTTYCADFMCTPSHIVKNKSYWTSDRIQLDSVVCVDTGTVRMKVYYRPAYRWYKKVDKNVKQGKYYWYSLLRKYEFDLKTSVSGVTTGSEAFLMAMRPLCGG